MGQRPTSEAKPNEQNALGFATRMGEYREFTYPHSPNCFLKWRLVLLAQLRFAYGALPHSPLVALPPGPCQGDQSEMTLAVIGWTPALAFAR